MSEAMNIQWYPGHMTKARRMILENTKLIDAVCEVVDARIPYSSRNPDLDDMTPGKPRIIVLNRVDQADTARTKKWAAFFRSSGALVIETDCKSGKGVGGLHSAVRTLLEQKIEKNKQKGQPGKKLRLMVVGIPNVGKSSFINRLAGRKAAHTSDRPGVTRGKQWISLEGEIELLDTPGVLWPKFEDQTVAENLAFTGAIRDAILDIQTLAANLMARLSQNYFERIAERYKIPADAELLGYELLELAARKRGFLISGGEVDTERMAIILLDEFRGGKLGRITLEDVR
ncbi:MAG: ribosome biogenesis GTPase YlqF [Oscillospiraceae bacterium]|nr:ribosome biogenesis GTPase YlqF [Oscillospiraceae bacterium]MCL2278094.1 ribosome biogenesis GTPase YlqF [Oscillospiraceae bacterium]